MERMEMKEKEELPKKTPKEGLLFGFRKLDSRRQFLLIPLKLQNSNLLTILCPFLL